MRVKRGDRETVTLHPGNLTMEQPLDMTLFSITDYRLDNVTTGIHMTIKMKRKITSEMMTTFFPSLLLMMITYATTFFKPFFFEAALSVNLTTMLVMTTIFISKMEGLPPTSATKMIDYWLILCQLVPFTQVVLLTAMKYLGLDGQEQGEENPAILNENEDESETEQAWHEANSMISRTYHLKMLGFVGKQC